MQQARQRELQRQEVLGRLTAGVASLERSLVVLGYEVCAAEAREQVNAALGGRGCSVAVIDMQMPGERLEEFLREFGARHPRTPIVLMSGNPEQQLTDALRALTPAPVAAAVGLVLAQAAARD